MPTLPSQVLSGDYLSFYGTVHSSDLFWIVPHDLFAPDPLNVIHQVFLYAINVPAIFTFYFNKM